MADTRSAGAPPAASTDEFKAQAVRLVLDEGKSVGAAARDLDLTESALRDWVERARADRTQGQAPALTTAEREELARLRKENRELRMEREILKKAAAFFAKRPAVKFALDRGGEGRTSAQPAVSRARRVARAGSTRGAGGRSRRTRSATAG